MKFSIYQRIGFTVCILMVDGLLSILTLGRGTLMESLISQPPLSAPESIGAVIILSLIISSQLAFYLFRHNIQNIFPCACMGIFANVLAVFMTLIILSFLIAIGKDFLSEFLLALAMSTMSIAMIFTRPVVGGGIFLGGMAAGTLFYGLNKGLIKLR